MAEIQIDHVWKTFKDGTSAVKDATITVADGEFFILVGPSGCGKSTLLNMIVGLEDVSDGTISVDGEVVNDVDPKDREMAMVFQSYAIYPHMTVRENMAFPLKLAKMPKPEIAERVDKAAEMLELTDLLDRKPAHLSGGQRQRVAMGRAIVREPLAFLMDEPLSNLDAKLRVQMRTQLSDLQRRLGTTTVYVTHDQTEAMTLGQRVAVLRRGEVQQVDAPKELYRNPRNLFVAGFIGSPAMNFVPAEIEGRSVQVARGTFPLPEEVAARYEGGDRRVLLGIRPENIEDARFVDDGLRDQGLTFTAKIDLVEWLGADVFAYFTSGQSAASDLERLADDLDVVAVGEQGEQRIAARLDRSSTVSSGDEAELWLDGRAIHLFDPESGESLLRPIEVDLRDQAAGQAGDSPDEHLVPG